MAEQLESQMGYTCRSPVENRDIDKGRMHDADALAAAAYTVFDGGRLFRKAGV